MFKISVRFAREFKRSNYKLLVGDPNIHWQLEYFVSTTVTNMKTGFHTPAPKKSSIVRYRIPRRRIIISVHCFVLLEMTGQKQCLGNACIKDSEVIFEIISTYRMMIKI